MLIILHELDIVNNSLMFSQFLTVLIHYFYEDLFREEKIRIVWLFLCYFL